MNCRALQFALLTLWATAILEAKTMAVPTLLPMNRSLSTTLPTDLLATGATLQKVADGFKFVEGPVWTDLDGGYLIFSDIPASRLIKWSANGGIETFRSGSDQSNGNARDPQGRLVSCEHATRRVTITEKDGGVRVLVDTFEGKKFNSPNDIVVKSNGSIWFTDPIYGLGKRDKEQPGQFVYRFDPATGKLTIAAHGFDQPNGLCFSPDEKRLYIADSGKPHHIRVFSVDADDQLSGGDEFCVIVPGVPDGMRCDAVGRLWSSAGDGIHIFNPDGEQIGLIQVPKTPANLCFGGPEHKTLFITARDTLYRIDLAVGGAIPTSK